MPHQNRRMYHTHYEWLQLIYNIADVDAILKAIKDVEKSGIHVCDIMRGLNNCTFEVVE